MSGSRTLCFIAFLTLAVVLIAAFSATAEVPQKINYQGRLIDNVTGEPRVGSHSITFRLYDAASGGAELWSESHVVIADSAGVFGTILGSTSPLSVAFDGPTWLEVEVMGEILVPRRELVSVPYAFRASGADSLGGHGAGEFVLKGELSSITAEMIVDGAGSGLDADMVDGFHADAFADSGHTHDDRYYTQDSLSTPGEVNDASNPVDWTKLKGIPSGLADGTDDVGEAADGYSLDADDGDPIDAVYVDAEGDVGIGTTTPGEKLEVGGTIHSTSGGFKFPDGTVQSTAVTGVEIGGGWVDDSTVVRLESLGDSVGIGTGTPGAKLDVAGTVRVEGFNLPTGADSGYVLTSDADGNGAWQAPAVYADTAHNHDDLYYTESDLNTSDGDDPNVGSNRLSWDNLTDVPADFADGSDEVGGSGDGHSLDAADGDPTNVVYVNNEGDVGVGTTAPDHELDIVGTVRADGFIMPSDTSYGYVLTSDSSGMGTWQPAADGHSLNSPNGFFEDALYVDNNADVGIGITDPQGNLHIYSDYDEPVMLTLENPNTGSNSTLRIGFDDENGSLCGITAFDDDSVYPNHLRMFNNRPGGRVILASARIGINTNDPQSDLDVNGTLQTDGFKLPTGAASGYVLTSDFGGTATWQPSAVGDGHSLDADDGDPVDALYVNQYGHVGIGTDYPMWDLHLHDPDPDQCVMLLSNAATGTGTGDGLRLTMSNIDGNATITNFESGYLMLGSGGYIPALTIDPDMKVGINEDEPNYTLHIHRGGTDTDCYMQITNYTIGNTATDGLLMGIDYEGNAYLENKEEGPLLFRANDDTHLAITSDGDVGIGTTTPAHELHLHNSSIAPAYLGISSYNTGWGQYDGFKIGVDDAGEAYLLNHENTGLTLATDNLLRMYIAADGNIGVGTMDPASKLHLHRNGPSTCYAQWTNGTTGTGFNDGLRVGIYMDGRAYIINTENTFLGIATNNTERMRIAANGDVGIGDDDPKVKLAVTGVARIQDLAAWPTQGEGMELAYDADLNRGYIQVYDRDAASWGTLSLGSGNVGIGTGNPAVKFEVKGNDPFVGLNTTNNKTGLRFQKNGTTEWEMAWNEGSGYLYLYNSGTRMVVEDATGDVGIGTVTPTSRLDVSGTAGHSQLRLRNSYTPTGTADTNGETGDVAWDNNFVYVKTSAGWKRSTLSTF